MKTLLNITFGLIFLISYQTKTDTTGFQNGDIIFQTSTSAQSKAIQMATGSKYSHMGIIYKQGNNFLVYEAVQPVKFTLLNDWIKRGENGHYVVKRIKNYDKLLTTENLTKMKQVGEKYENKDYDLYFEWSSFANGIPEDATLSGIKQFGDKIYVTTDYHGVFIASNGENNWTPLNFEQLKNLDINCIEVDNNKLIIGTLKHGVLVSDNGGLS